MLLLAIESSCDETAAAVVQDGRSVLSSIISSQIDIHARFGGVVPELASRSHLEQISPVIEQALREAGCSMQDLQGIVCTAGPGLIGALLVGVSTAKALAYARNLPLAGVHHIEGHILSILLERQVDFPYLALAVSGGHTHLFRVEGIGSYQLIGRTVDDAAGEAFDKVAKIMGLPYPGGPQVDRLAQTPGQSPIRFPRPMLKQDNFNFSFSGIKTAVMQEVQKHPAPLPQETVVDISRAFQEAVVDVLTQKAFRAAQAQNLNRIVVAGGVACNSGLRNRFEQLASKNGCEVFFPSVALCADNAAMLAVAGDYYLGRGLSSPLELNARSSWPLDEVCSPLGVH